MANYLVAIVQSSYCMAGNNALLVYESYRPGKKIIVDINKLITTCTFFVHEVISIRVQENSLCNPKKFRAIIGKNFISVDQWFCISNCGPRPPVGPATLMSEIRSGSIGGSGLDTTYVTRVN